MKTVAPESVGLSSARLGRIRGAIQRRIESRELAGAISLVARRGRVAYFDCQGLMDVEAGRPMATNAILRFYSMTKPVTAAALLTLYEEGMFRLDDPVSAYIPELSRFTVLKRLTGAGPETCGLARPITIRHLFTHTSGIGYPDPRGTPAERAMAAVMGPTQADSIGMSLEEFIPVLAKTPLAHQPGEGWTYGYSIDVLGRLAEILTGKPFDVFLKERILGPLGMVDTDFFVPEDKRGRLCKVYRRREEDGRLEVVQWATDAFWKKWRLLSGGGGLVSTAADYLRFAQMLLNGGSLDGTRILGRKTVELLASDQIQQIMHLPEIAEGRTKFGPGHTFGLGVKVLIDESAGLYGSRGTFGWSGLASTSFWVDPREELTAMILPQMIDGPLDLQDQFRTLVYQALE